MRQFVQTLGAAGLRMAGARTDGRPERRRG